MKDAFRLIFAVLAVFFLIGCSAPVADKKDIMEGTPSAPEEKPQTVNDVVEGLTERQNSVPSEIKELIEKAKYRVSSVSYFYKGPENENEIYTFFIKGSRIKYVPPRAVKSLDFADSYDSVFIDVEKKTAEKYCDDITCEYRGKKESLNFNEAYILTPFDWVSGITKAEKVGEEKIENRNTWKLLTNKGTVWVDSYYGIAFKAESEGNSYKYTQLSFDKVKDSDVVPFDAQ